MKMKSWFVLGFLGGLIFAAAANAGVQFLPEAMSNGGAANMSASNSRSCIGFSSQAKRGSGWECQTCTKNGVTKYKCKKLSCPQGFRTGRHSCGNNMVLESGGYSGDQECTRCVNQ